MSKQAEFVSRGLSLAVLAHFEHLKTGSYETHVALGGLYEALPGLVDAYAEHYQGMYGKIPEYPGFWSPSPKDIIATIQLFCDWITENRQALSKGSLVLENDIADMQGALYSALYKLKELK